MAVNVTSVSYNNEELKNLSQSYADILDAEAIIKEYSIEDSEMEVIVENSSKAIILGFLSKSEIPGRKYDFNSRYVITTDDDCLIKVFVRKNRYGDAIIFAETDEYNNITCLIGAIKIHGRLVEWINPESRKTCEAFEWKLKTSYKIDPETELGIYVIDNDDIGMSGDYIDNIIESIIHSDEEFAFSDDDYDEPDEEELDDLCYR